LPLSVNIDLHYVVMPNNDCVPTIFPIKGRHANAIVSGLQKDPGRCVFVDLQF